MPFQPINFANIPLQQNRSWIPSDFAEALQSAYKMPQEMETAKLQQSLLRSQIEESQRKANTPPSPFAEYSGLPADIGGQYLLLDILKKKSEQNPNDNRAAQLAANLEKALMSRQKKDETLSNRYSILSSTQPYRLLSSDAKKESEAYFRGMGIDPIEGIKMLTGNTSLEDIAESKGIDLNEVTPIYAPTSPIITKDIQARQAEAEISELAKYAQKGLEPYADTFAGYNPQQIMDTFRTDETSQKKLGKFIASQQLQFEIAQNQIRLAMGQPGVTTTQELMDLGMQRVSALYPKLSGKARQEAQNYFIEALKAGNEARQKVSHGSPASVKKPEKHIPTWNAEKGDFE